jgi:lipopolysaccharide cholinephosphotransferase
MNDHQKVLFDMLEDIDDLCRREGIRYMLFSGTLLGAVRHKGFIPWDDDADIILMRSEYERLLTCAEEQLDRSKYYVQREFSDHWPMQFSKLRLNGTACMEKFRPKDALMHQGVYVDIFPCDCLPKGKLGAKLRFAASKAVIAKSLFARGYETNSITKKLFIQLCRLLPGEPLKRFCIGGGKERSSMVHTFFAGGSRLKSNVFPRAWIEKTVDMPFEGRMFPVSAHYDELLTKLYGDYMTLPTPEERKCKEHFSIVDLEHSYEVYLEDQMEASFDVFSRSIR